MDDLELEVLKRRKLKEMERRLENLKRPSETPVSNPFEVVQKWLIGRGKEVLDAARSQYPEATNTVVTQLALLFEKGKLRETITGEQLFALLRKLGIPVRLETRIFFEDHGEVKSLAEKLREEL